jgi:hypothetical protein
MITRAGGFVEQTVTGYVFCKAEFYLGFVLCAVESPHASGVIHIDREGAVRCCPTQVI